MLLRTVFIVTPGAVGLQDMALPLEVMLNDDVRVSLYAHEDGRLRAAVHRVVDTSQLDVVLEGSGWFTESPEGQQKPLPRLRLRSGMPAERVVMDDFVSALTFLTDAPLSISRPHNEDAFIAEPTMTRNFCSGLALTSRCGKPAPRSCLELSPQSSIATPSSSCSAARLACAYTRMQ